MTRACMAFLATLILSVPAGAADPAYKPTPATVTPTAAFVQAAVVGNLFEVETSKLALERSQSEAVKTFAQHMVDDHSAAGVKFTDAANQATLPLPPPPFKLDAEHQAMLDELRAKRGADFDRSYIDMQQRAHVDAVELFKGYAATGDNAALKATAAELLPKLQQHLDQVSNLKSAPK